MNQKYEIHIFKTYAVGKSGDREIISLKNNLA